MWVQTQVNPIARANYLLSVIYWVNVKTWVIKKKDLAIKFWHFQLLCLLEFCLIFKYWISFRFQLISDKCFHHLKNQRFSFLKHWVSQSGTEHMTSDILSVVFSENSSYKAGPECTQHQFLSEGRILGLSDFSWLRFR